MKVTSLKASNQQNPERNPSVHHGAAINGTQPLGPFTTTAVENHGLHSGKGRNKDRDRHIHPGGHQDDEKEMEKRLSRNITRPE